MDNTRSDELRIELELQNRTYANNRVTRTIKPAIIKTAVTDKMVDEYKKELASKMLKTGKIDTSVILSKPTLDDLTPYDDEINKYVKSTTKADEKYRESVEVHEKLLGALSLKEKEYDDASIIQYEPDYINNITILTQRAVPIQAQADILATELKTATADDKKIISKKRSKLLKDLREINANIVSLQKLTLENKTFNVDAEDKSNRAKIILEKEIKDIRDAVETNEKEIEKYKGRTQDSQIKLREASEARNKIERDNKEKFNKFSKDVSQYKDDYLPQQTPGEDDDAYMKRLEDYTKLPFDDADIKEAANYDQLKLLKSNFSSLFNMNNQKRISIVEAVIKQLSADDIYTLNTIWEGYKKVYMELYGFDNANVTPDDILDALNNISGAPPSAPSGVTKGKPSASSQPSAYKNVLQTNTGTLYYAYFYDNVVGPDWKYIGISKTGDVGTFVIKPFFKTDDVKSSLDQWSVIDPTMQTLYEDIEKANGTDWKIVWTEFLNENYNIADGKKKASGPPSILSNYNILYSKNVNILPTPLKSARVKKAGTKILNIIGAGISIPKHDKVVNFGNVLLMYDRLLRHNMLSIKKKGGGNIENFKNVKVSDKFVDIITGALNKQNINNIYNELSEKEQELYNILVQVSNVHRYANIPKPNIKFLKDRLKIVEGEIEAGNDNLIEELTDILHTMILVKLITKKEATQHLQQYMDMNQ